MNTFLYAAIQYLEYGWSVIPLAEGTKIPPKGFSPIPYRERLATVDEINSWWTENPNYNIGIVTGKLSNLFVIDIDTEEGNKNIDALIPESLIVPTVDTPRGGKHLYFNYPKNHNITIGAGKIEGSDFRGENGYIVAPPSINGNGKPYKWVIDPFSTKMSNADLPLLYINKLILSIGHTQNAKIGQTVTGNFNLNKGHRDETLYHIAHCLIKGGASKDDTINTLKIIANSCNPPFPESEIVTKCHSVLARADRKERNITQEISDYISVTTGYFLRTNCDKELGFVTKSDKDASRKVFSRLKEKGIIEAHPNTYGLYRRVETNFDFINFDENEEPEKEYPVVLPLGLNDLAEISQGNIILVAGEFNAGKTSFLLNVLRFNKKKLPIRYITSEMSKSEFKKRFASFIMPLSFWKQDDMTEYIRKSSEFHTVIKPDALNIIDYMEFRDSDYTKGAEYLTKIHDALKTGIAIVAVQKKEGLRMPRSGDMIVEKPRLAISLSKYNSSGEYPQGIAEILKCKMPKLGKVDGRKCRFELQKNGSHFHVLNEWGYLKF